MESDANRSPIDALTPPPDEEAFLDDAHDPASDSSFEGFNEAHILKQFAEGRTEKLTTDQRSVDLRPGIVINRRFKILKQLGFGGMGAVYLVKDSHLKERRALKVMLPRLLSNPQAQRRFLIETKISQRLAHQNIVRVHDLGVDFNSGMQFFTMALVPLARAFCCLAAACNQI